MKSDSILQRLQTTLGFAYSFLIYYGIPLHHRFLTGMYAPFIKPGDLCFDIGAHLGDRVYAWSKLGARVIALEPNPSSMKWLRRWYGHRTNVVLVEQAVSAHPGTADLWISRLTPSVSTLSQKWLNTVSNSPRFAGVRWNEQVQVTVTTLDALIAQYGRPAFCKIDVEGAELDVLNGLSDAIPALSFEYIPAMIETAVSCIARLSELGNYEYNWRVSEFPRLRSHTWLESSEMISRLRNMSSEDDSGDVYARLIP